MTSPRQVSIVVPALDEESRIRASLGALPPSDGSVEVLVVDGGSRDGTRDVALSLAADLSARGLALEVVQAQRGRAQQMNSGAARARGEVLLFQHADTLLPAVAYGSIRDALDDPGVVGGAFHHRFQEEGAGLRVVSACSNLRARIRGTFYGDQGIFIRRSAFEALGGFRRIPVFEDVDLSIRMRRLGRTVLLRAAVRTSARRYLQGGVARTAWRMARMKIAYLGGGDPHRVAGDYWEPASRGEGPGSDR